MLALDVASHPDNEAYRGTIERACRRGLPAGLLRQELRIRWISR